MTMNEIKERLDKLSHKHQAAKQVVATERKAIKRAKLQIKHTIKAQKIVQQIAEKVQQRAHKRIAAVVTRCLRSVFGDDAYAFKLVFRRLRGRTEAVLAFERNGEEIKPLAASGGGVVDVAAFALRLACLLLVQPSLRRLVVLDEPFKFVSAEYRDSIRKLLETLAQELDVQFVIVTHIEELETGKVVKL